MKNTMIILAGVLACVSCTNNGTDGAAVGLKAGKSSSGNEIYADHNKNTGKKDPDMDSHEMYNYGDTSTHTHRRQQNNKQ